MVTKFILFGCIGMLMELFWTGLLSFLKGDKKLLAYTYLWMLPIYGVAAFFEPFYLSISSFPIVLRGGIYTLIIFAVEYFSGFLLESFTGQCPWDYGDVKTAVDGFIRIDYAPLWFIAGLIFEYFYRIF